MQDRVEPKSDAEFEEIMESIDTILRKRGVAIPARSLMALSELSRTCRLELPVTVSQRAPTPGIFTGEDLSLRVKQWYNRRYGDSEKKDFSIGRIAVLIRDDFWAMYFPPCFGTIRVTTTPLDVTDRRVACRPGDPPPVYNLIDGIRKLPPGLRTVLTQRECQQIHESGMLGFDFFMAACGHEKIPFVREALNDFDAAVMWLTDTKRSAAQSRWASLQAVEKLFKALMAERRIRVPKCHFLAELARLTEDLVSVPVDLLRIVQCSPGIRYGEEDCAFEEALQAHQASIRIGRQLVCCLGNGKS